MNIMNKTMNTYTSMRIGREILLALLLIFSIYIILSLPYLQRGYIVDDTFIHLRFAENLRQHHEMSFNPGESVYGASSPLWIALLSVSSFAFDELPLLARVYSFIFGFLAIVTLFILVKRLFCDDLIAVVTCIILATDPFFIRWSNSGMEASLAASVVFLVFSMHHLERQQDRIFNMAPIAAGIAYLVRPECAILGAVIFIDYFLSGSDKRRCLLRFLAGAALFLLTCAPWLFYALRTFNTIVPATAVAKGAYLPLFSQLVPTALRLAKTIALTHWMQIVVIGVTISLLLLRGRGRVQDLKQHFYIIAWIVTVMGLYIAGGNIVSRYLLMVTPLLTMYTVRSLSILTEGNRRKCIVQLIALAAFLVSWNIIVAQRFFMPVLYSNYLEQMTKVGKWIEKYSPKNSLIATDEIGIIGFYSKRKILDLEGLVTPAIIPYKYGNQPSDIPVSLFKGRIFDYLKEARPDFVVHQSLAEKSITATPIGREFFVPIMSFKHEQNMLAYWKPGAIKYVNLYKCFWHN